MPIAVAVGGAALAFSSVFVNNHPVSAPEMRRLADEYNTALRRRLSEPPRADAQTRIRVVASPYAGRGGGGLVLRASF